MANELRTSKNVAQIVGRLSEKALTKETVTKEIDGKKVQMEVIKGSVSVETVNGTFTARIYSQSQTKNGENKMFKGFNTIYTEYKDKTTHGEDAAYVSMKVSLDENAYLAQDGTLKLGTQMNIKNANRSSKEGESITDVEIEGVIKAIKPEVKGDEETGRLIVELVTIAYGGRAQIIEAIVPEELADDFEGLYEKGNTATLYLEVKMVTVGGGKKKGNAFGRTSKVKEGFDRMEILVVGGEEPIDADEEDNKAYDVNDIATALKERELAHEKLLKDAKDKGKKDKAEPKTSGGLGAKKKVVEEDSDLPF
ncbi:MAG: hypothetical protein ACRCX8_14365 [Sarcina sp.]